MERPENTTATEWDADEKHVLSELREAAPPSSLEDLTVARLHREGLLRTAESHEPTFLAALRAFFTMPRLAVAGGGLAFVAAVFLAGVVVGQRSAVQATADALASYHEDTLTAASARVQRTGSAYVAALSALGRLAVDAEPVELEPGREVALAALYSAAEELVRLDPNDPVAARIIQGLEQQDGEARTETKREVLWF